MARLQTYRTDRRVLAGCAWLATALPAAAEDVENAAQALARPAPPARAVDNAEEKALYAVGYAHLDTQWRWDFVTTIDEYVRATLDDNFALFERYPDYTFNFTGSVRYEMMKEYYPERYERLKEYIRAGRWFVSGSSVDEGDVNVPSPESIIRQVLYGNLYFKREFDKESVDFMLPDCFGFPASLPSIWAHCGLIGFSTQKLSWGSAVGIPFPVGVWVGTNGDSVIAALDPGAYSTGIDGRPDQSSHWVNRVEENGRLYGLWADYHYYGVGDIGGAPREQHVRSYVESANAPDARMGVLLASSDQLYRDITPEVRARLPRYQGDMLLTEHSAGTLTSQSYMKRWNRHGEQLADAAERAAVAAWWLTGAGYPRAKLERGWIRLLANQMHDILPGTSIPRAYRYSWNDDVIALNHFADTLTHAAGQVAGQLDTRGDGAPLVVFNPLAIARSDAVTARVPHGGAAAVRVFGPDGEVPSQVLARDGEQLEILFLAEVPANGFRVFHARPAEQAFDDGAGPRIGPRELSNETYTVKLDEAGDIASIVDHRHERELLAGPARLVFTHEKPRDFPAWNMDWADRQRPPLGYVDGAPRWRIVEDGPVRVALAVTRQARNSEFTQVIRLTRGDAGTAVEVDATIDWQSTGCALKASFPLAVANPEATYNWSCGTIARGNNDPKKYEVPSHEWFDLTDRDGAYGVTVLEDSKFGSDKPADNEVRLTLLYTPAVRRSYMDQHSQDWGVHRMRYGLHGHSGDWRAAGSEWHGRRFNQPLRAFAVEPHAGPLGRTFTLLETSTPQIDVRAVKLAETGDQLIVRVQELHGQPVRGASVTLPGPIRGAREVCGQERPLGAADFNGSALSVDLEPYGLRAYAIDLAPRSGTDAPPAATPVKLPFDTDVASLDADRTDGAMDAAGRSYPGELLPATLVDRDVRFELGASTPGAAQALTCRGQELDLPAGGDVHILAAASDDAEALFQVDGTPQSLAVQAWTGFIGQWYDRVWDGDFEKVDFQGDHQVRAILPGYIKRDPVAWFATHRHDPEAGNEAYRFSYIYHYVLPRAAGGPGKLRLPHDERIRIFALSLADRPAAVPAAALYDELAGGAPLAVRHNYGGPGVKVFARHQPRGNVATERAASFEQLVVGPPRDDDDVDAGRDQRFQFQVFAPTDDLRIHPGSGARDGILDRLNDGVRAQNDDDTRRCVWYDNEGRFTLDLNGPRTIEQVTTYSWHRAGRAPQYFSLWGARAEQMPDPGFAAGHEEGWELLAVVDTRPFGHGQIHATRVRPADQPLGPYRHLLWISEDVGDGTFFTEIDIDFAADAR